ncbi:Cilia- and flagella-associated protein 70 [Liparis tanakae]|uniref:Cilia-and flagella-associated protein 70 n=1 Tax=Liparis tanakae TaxID=230148 RepID=A0A4Z2EVB1_9TELE|nr:Cilia- and flagella-associated protein 70 [Liparis tanakae]
METPVNAVETNYRTIKITVVRGNNLQARRPSSVQVDMDGEVLGESDRKLLDPKDQRVHYDFTCSLRVPGGASCIDTVTVRELLPAEKKLEAKQAVLGQAVVDLLPLLYGRSSFLSTVPLNPASVPSPKGASPVPSKVGPL